MKVNYGNVDTTKMFCKKRDSLSVFGYEDLGFWKGRTLECESIIEDLEELLK